ncbi:MAG: hypothetical protein ACFE9C_14415 [Candidatus Hodarchaeota archaeon]
MLVTSLGEYKKKFQIESFTEDKEHSLRELSITEFRNLQNVETSPEDEYLSISNDIHAILLNCSELTNSQKLDFCNNQRYFMKLYLKQLVIKINRV